MGIAAALGKVIILHAVLERDSGQNDRACQHNQQRADQIGCCKAGAGHGIQRGERSDVKQRCRGQHTQADRNRNSHCDQSHQHRNNGAGTKRRNHAQSDCQQIAPDAFELGQLFLHPVGADIALRQKDKEHDDCQNQIDLGGISNHVA